MGLLRTSEESRPLVLNTPSPTSGSMHTISDGYVNEGICDPDKIISSKFGDSCRKSLTSVLDKSYKDTCEFDLKKHFLRETSSGKCSSRAFSSRALPRKQLTNKCIYDFGFHSKFKSENIRAQPQANRRTELSGTEWIEGSCMVPGGHTTRNLLRSAEPTKPRRFSRTPVIDKAWLLCAVATCSTASTKSRSLPDPSYVARV